MIISSPLVSVIVPCYNHEKYVTEAIQSVIDQTYVNIELIVLNDGSKDNTHNKVLDLEETCKERFVNFIYINKVNEGVSKTLNSGILLSKGNFISFLASDDLFLPTKIEKQVNTLLRSPDSVGGIYSDGYIINDFGERTAYFTDNYHVPIGKNIYKELIVENWIGAISLLYRREALFEVGLFTEGIKVEDHDMLLKFTAKFKLLYLNECLFEYRFHENNTSANFELMQEQLKVTALNHPTLNKFIHFQEALKRKNFTSVLRNASLLNFELIIRKSIRKVQARFDISNTTPLVFLNVVLYKLSLLAKYSFSNLILKARGLKLGKGCKIKGKIVIHGLLDNVSLGDNVKVLGNLRLVADLNYGREKIEVGNNCILDHNCTLFTHGGTIKIGKNCFLGPMVHIQAKGGVVIDDNTMIAGHTSLFASNHVTADKSKLFNSQGEKFKGIYVGKNCWIGANCVILDGAYIGDNSVVGAGCVVRGFHPSNSKILAKDVVAKTYPFLKDQFSASYE
ncbi:glycosyltransferase [Pontibacter sp. MBLB2868]|uniref:glycosyltransferase n=1 Tax=Pontibacter sp. MBLB2868 TaxID=3451555 RepID=UPI003F756512